MPEYGPYEQPGWPSTLPYFKPGETFRNAFAITSEVNRRKQALENQVMKMDLDARNRDITHQIAIAEYQRKLDQGNQRLAIAEQTANLRDTIHQDNENRLLNSMDDLGNLAQDIHGIKVPTTDPGYESAVWDVLQKNRRALPTRPGWNMAHQAFQQANIDRKVFNKKLDSEDAELTKDIKNTIGRGQSTDRDLLYHPEVWTDEWVDKRTGESHKAPPLDDKGRPTAEFIKQHPEAAHWKPSGQQYATVKNSGPDALTNPNIYIKLPAQKLTELRSRLKAIDERKANRPSQMTNEYASAIPDRSDYPQPTASDIAYIKAHPEAKTKFEARFGPGTSDHY